MAFEVEEPLHLDSWWTPKGQKLFDKECTGDDYCLDEQVEFLLKILATELKAYLAKGGKTSVLEYGTLREWFPDQGFNSTGKKPNKTPKRLCTRCAEYEMHEQHCHAAEAASAGEEVVMLAEPSADCHAAQAVAYHPALLQAGTHH